MRSLVLAAVLAIPSVALPVASAEANTLVYRYTGNTLVADDAANLDYLRSLLALDYPVDDEILGAIVVLSQPAAEFDVTIDEAALPGGSVRGQTVSVGRYGSNFRGASVELPYDFPSFATETLTLTFDEAAQIVDWNYDVYWEVEEFSSDPTGDVYGFDPTGQFCCSPSLFLRWKSVEPGRWARVEGAPAPIPVPASLPLALAGLGAFGLIARRRRGAVEKPAKPSSAL